MANKSHPSWVCGLKLQAANLHRRLAVVTPFVGVWIETPLVAKKRRATYSHTLRGCVD